MTTGVVLLNMGGPAAVGEVRTFLRELFNDPAILGVPWPIRPALAEYIVWKRGPASAERYRRLGGRSPLLQACDEQADALAEQLGWPVRVAMRYLRPSAGEALDALQAEGVTRVVALPLFPQYSTTTSETALAVLDEAALVRDMEVVEIPSYPDAPGLIEALADSVAVAAEELPALGPARAHLLLTAHGIPLRRVQKGDPYPSEVVATATALTDVLELDTPWSLAYQSRVGPTRWLEPSVEDEVRRLAADGVRALVVQPLSFTSENLETLDDLDRDLAEVARNAHISLYRRGAAPGCHPAFIGALADLAGRRAVEAGWEADDA